MHLSTIAFTPLSSTPSTTRLRPEKCRLAPKRFGQETDTSNDFKTIGKMVLRTIALITLLILGALTFKNRQPATSNTAQPAPTVSPTPESTPAPTPSHPQAKENAIA